MDAAAQGTASRRCSGSSRDRDGRADPRGGFGYLTPARFGWAADNLEEVEIVTADGRIPANRTENPELFWAPARRRWELRGS
ncbi:MAG: hypothetical protein R2716_09745 [Microthrixaceae bacterium]